MVFIAAVCALGGAARGVDFEREVRPILVRSCVGCHGAEKHKSGLRLDLREEAMRGGDSGRVIVPGKADASLLIQLVSGEDPDRIMPAKGRRLTADEIGVLRRWIDEGAMWPADRVKQQQEQVWWSLAAVKRPAAPQVHGWGRNAIDAFVLAKLEKAGLRPAPEADRRTLIRRVSYDLTGLAPSYQEVEAFVTDSSPDAYEKLVDRLLASPQYGERWGRHWLDVVRYADSNGFEMNQPRPNAWPYRDYVIRAFNQDKPYDQFMREQLAGDAMGVDEATGFLVAGPWDQVKSPDPVLTAQQRADELHDMVSVTGATFLGLTVGCARCHNHKFDPISQSDYYRMTALFAGVQHGERGWSQEKTGLRPAVAAGRNEDAFAAVEAKFVRFTIHATNDGAEPCIDELEIHEAGTGRNVALASGGAKVSASGTLKGYAIHQLGHLNDGLYGNGHSWICDTAGRGWVEVELAAPVKIDRVVWGRDREGRFQDRLAVDYVIEVGREKGKWKRVASSADRNPSQAKVYAGVFVQPGPTHRLARGDPMQPKEEVSPGAIAALGGFTLPSGAPERERRIALGKWLSDAKNPLPARVIVNRLWHWHFGRGIVATPSDFGHMGAEPTHRELLDYLASELVERGWRLKQIQRLIVLSATYRQASAANTAGMEKDSGDTLLWRYPPQRLDAEAIRDSILRVSGKLDLRMGGPGYDVFAPNSNYVRVYAAKQELGPGEWRRMVYQFHPRLQPEPTFGVFDCPDGGQPAPKRTVSTTSLQALNLLNSSFMMQQATFFAARVEREGGKRPEEQVRLAFELALERRPNAQELAASVAFVNEQGLVLLCRALLNTNEFVTLE